MQKRMLGTVTVRDAGGAFMVMNARDYWHLKPQLDEVGLEPSEPPYVKSIEENLEVLKNLIPDPQ